MKTHLFMLIARRIALALPVAALAFIACVGGSETVAQADNLGGSETVGMFGLLVDTASAPAAGAIVRVYSIDDSTTIVAADTANDTGRYEIDSIDLTPALYALTALYESGGQTLIAFRDSIDYRQPGLDLGVDTLRAPGAIRGRALRAGATAHAGIHCYVPGTSWSAITDSAGAFTIHGIAPGVYRLTRAAPGYAAVSLDSVTVSPADTTVLGAATLQIDTLAPVPSPHDVRAAYREGASSITLSWRAIPLADLYGYHVYLDTGESSSRRLTQSPISDTVLVYRHPGALSPGRAAEMRFHVTAVDRDGNESLRSPAPAVTPALSVIISRPVQTIEYGGAFRCSVAVLDGPEDVVIEVDFDGGRFGHDWIALDTGATLLDTTVETGEAVSWPAVLARITGPGVAIDTALAVHIRPRPLDMTVAAAADTGFALTWTKSPDADFAAYLIFARAGDTLMRIDSIGAAADTALVYRTLAPDSHTFWASAIDTEGVAGAPGETARAAIRNSSPSFAGDSILDTARAGRLFERSIPASDPNGDPVTLTLLGEAHGAALDGRLFSWTPPAGSAPVRWRMCAADGRGGADTLPLTIVVETRDTIIAGADLTAARRYHQCAAAGGSVYVFGGCADRADPLDNTVRQITLASTERLDPETRDWKPVDSPLHTGRYAMGAAVVSDAIYVFGGLHTPNEPLNTVERFDPATETWSVIDTTPVPIYGCAAAVHASRVYLSGGIVDRAVQPTVSVYDPATGHWSEAGAMTVPRAYHRMSARGDRLVIAGGFSGLPDGAAESSTELFDLDEGAGREALGLINRRMHFALAACNDTLYLIGGHDRDMRMHQSIERRDNDTNLLRVDFDAIGPRQGLSACMFNAAIVITGGAPGIAYPNPGQSASTWILYP
jgi:hypothetical protein